MVDSDELRKLIEANAEWLLVRASGRSFPLTRKEIVVEDNSDLAAIRFFDDSGLHAFQVFSCRVDKDELLIEAASTADGEVEEIRLVPRASAASLAAEIELARLKKANEVAELISERYPGSRIVRVALNAEGGRLAQITFLSPDKTPIAATADITGAMTVEAVLTAAMLWVETLGIRKHRPINDIWMICEKRQARNARKLITLLTNRWKSKITIFELDRKTELLRLTALPNREIRNLWSEKPQKITLPPFPIMSEIASRITSLAPAQIDTIYSNKGETLRYLGLPFARVRQLARREKAWFGIGKEFRSLTDETWSELSTLIDRLSKHRSHDPITKRHESYRASTEAWLESILRRDISWLDANLILSPVYNQFRSSNDRIDLLALRRDGRLVIIELKVQPDRQMVFQAIDYWRKIELQRRRGLLKQADLFESLEIMDKPALIYLVAPAWSFHRDFEFFAKSVSPEIELWRFELHENWREHVKVIARHSYSEPSSGQLRQADHAGFTNLYPTPRTV